MSNMLGMGVMIQRLLGSQPADLSAVVGQEIRSVSLANGMREHRGDDTIVIETTGGASLSLHDGGQSCCETRYITTDDDLGYFAGSTLLDVEIGEHREIQGSDVHEVQFLNVKTSKGVITFETHNEHNGYYGGFAITASVSPPLIDAV